MIKGEKVTLELLEKEDIGYLHSWLTDPDFTGTHEPTTQLTTRELEKTYQNLKDEQWWFITNHFRTRIGFLTNQLREHCQEIKLYIIPEERGNGYGSEATKLIVDYLFLNQDLERVQALTPIENTAIQRVLEKSGFTSEGVIRKNRFHKGVWRDSSLFSIIRDEWSNPTQISSHKYYTDEHPSGPWSRALSQKRTWKPFDENEFKKDTEASPELQTLSSTILLRWTAAHA